MICDSVFRLICRICIMEEPAAMEAVDRISNLPMIAIDLIIEKMCIRDAAKTSILSKKWKYIWANSPFILLDKQFSNDIRSKRSEAQFQNDFVYIINRILLQHPGTIEKFVIDISDLSPTRYSDVDLWILFLSKKGVQELILDNSKPNPYKLPSCIFLFHEVRVLKVSNCIFKLPSSTFGGFGNLKKLAIKDTTLESFVLDVPLLTSLDLRKCQGIGNVRIHAPRLTYLCLNENKDLEISSYMICKDIEFAYLGLENGLKNQRDSEKINLSDFLGCWPNLSKFFMSGLVTEFPSKKLTAETVPTNLEPRLNHLKRLVLFRIRFCFDEIVWILCLLRSSPFLTEFEIWAGDSLVDDTNALTYLGQPDIMNQNIEQLRTVKMIHFTGVEVELAIVKLLLSCSPSLERIFIHENAGLDLNQQIRIAKKLMQFSRASTKAEMFLQPEMQ